MRHTPKKRKKSLRSSALISRSRGELLFQDNSLFHYERKQQPVLFEFLDQVAIDVENKALACSF